MLRDAIQALTTLVLVISIVNETPHSKRRRIFCKHLYRGKPLRM